jgi:hypothetical protein
MEIHFCWVSEIEIPVVPSDGIPKAHFMLAVAKK